MDRVDTLLYFLYGHKVKIYYSWEGILVKTFKNKFLPIIIIILKIFLRTLFDLYIKIMKMMNVIFTFITFIPPQIMKTLSNINHLIVSHY